jgi:hypothetical protein
MPDATCYGPQAAMLRNLFNALLLVMLLLQGVAQASVDAQPHSASLHCADHDAAKSDCPCCGDSWLAMAGSCATLCAAFVAMPPQSLDVPRAGPQLHRAAALQWRRGPDYLPLNPPPIS